MEVLNRQQVFVLCPNRTLTVRNVAVAQQACTAAVEQLCYGALLVQNSKPFAFIPQVGGSAKGFVDRCVPAFC